jgi:hypothetical protein
MTLHTSRYPFTVYDSQYSYVCYVQALSQIKYETAQHRHGNNTYACILVLTNVSHIYDDASIGTLIRLASLDKLTLHIKRDSRNIR